MSRHVIQEKLIHEVCCGAAVFNDNDEILIVRDKWDNIGLPKGQIDWTDTSSFFCAQREVQEETNIRFKEYNFYHTHYEEVRLRKSYSPRGKIVKHVILFSGKALNSDIQIQKDEIKEAKFVSLTEFDKLVKNNSLKRALSAILKLRE